MAILLDQRYLLLVDRPVRWLKNAWDGWDLVSDVPITVGWFSRSAPVPVLPATLRLQHPNILGLLDLRIEERAGTWAIWSHFGPVGADILNDRPISTEGAAWIAHEATQALAYARSALSRPGGFRIGDFGPDHIRLYEDGTVRVVGFGRIAAEHDEATELAILGHNLADWFTHSHEATGSPEAEETTASIAGELVGAVSLFSEADAKPQAVVPRLISALRASPPGGDTEVARLAHVPDSVYHRDQLQVQRDAYVAGQTEEPEERTTRSVREDDAVTDTEVLPPVRIAPRQPAEPVREAVPTEKGLPVQPRRRLPVVLVGMLVLLVVFAAWRSRSSLGWPGAGWDSQVLLETVPAGATVSFDDSLLVGHTPLPLDEVSIGWHRVRFEAADFPPIEDSILVYKREPHRPFRFVFTRPLRFESRPRGAVLYLNGRRASAPTPFVESDWPVTDELSLVMHLEGYGSIEDCILDPVYGTVEVADPAMWHVEPRGDTLLVQGLFVHSAAFFVSPKESRVTIDDTLLVNPSAEVSYALTFGTHKLRAEAVGYDPLDTTLVIGGQSPHILPLVLSRPVRIAAVDPRSPDVDLRVLVDRLEGPDRTIFVRRFTPYSVRMPAVAHTVTLRKRNYRDTTVYVPPDVNALTVAMTPEDARAPSVPPPTVAPEAPDIRTGMEPEPVARDAPWVNIEIEAPGSRSLAGAEVWARQSGADREVFLGVTDARGQLRTQIPVGNYDLLAYLDAFSGVRKRIMVRPSRNRPIVIELKR